MRVVDEFPEIVAALDGDQAEIARRHMIAPLIEVDRGSWQPRREVQPEPGHLGLLVLDGLLTRDVVLGETLASELVGYGDLLRPIDHDGQDAPVPFDVAWQVLEPLRIAVLDRQFARVAGHWPESIEVLMSHAVKRAQALAITLAVSHLRRVDAKLLVLLWYLADRWGKVRPDGVHVPLKITHQTLGRLVGAQRPSVTTTLTQLNEAGRVKRCPDGTWLLLGDPPTTLEKVRAETADERARRREETQAGEDDAPASAAEA